MKKIMLLFIAVLWVVTVPVVVHAGALILDLENASSGTTTTGSGDSIFQVSAISGTYTTTVAVGGTVIPNLGNYDRSYSIQINDIAFASGYPESDNNSGVTFEIFAQISNLNDSDAWSGASKIVLFSGGVAVSGNSIYVQSGTLPMAEYTRFGMTTGVTPLGRTTARATLK